MANVQSVLSMIDMAVKRGRSSYLYFADNVFTIKKNDEVLYTFTEKQDLVDHITKYGDLIPVDGSKESVSDLSSLITKFTSQHDTSVLGKDGNPDDSQMDVSLINESSDEEEEDDDEDGEIEVIQPKLFGTPNVSFNLFDAQPDEVRTSTKGMSAAQIAGLATSSSPKGKEKGEKAKGKEKEKKLSKAEKAKMKAEAKAKEKKEKKVSKRKAEALNAGDTQDDISTTIEESGDVAPTKKGRVKAAKKDESFEQETQIDLVTTLGYSPNDIRQEQKPITVQLLMDRMKNGEIDWKTFFQRHADLWSPAQKSLLIESILTNLRIPPICVDGANPASWLVVDGLQRLSAIRHFMLGTYKDTKNGPVKSVLKLSGLRLLPELNGMTYDRLPRDMKRRINEYSITVDILLPGTPDEVKFEIFERTNTGGLKLSPQEIRNALYHGPFLDVMRDVVDDGVFEQATHGLISTKRGTHFELILRHFAFRHFESSYTGDNKNFFNTSMKELNKLPNDELEKSQMSFTKSLDTAYIIWGKYAFRKVAFNTEIKPSMPISRTLFEVITVALARMTNEEHDKLIALSSDVREAFDHLLTVDEEYISALTHHTNDPKVFKARMTMTQTAFHEILANTFFDEKKDVDVESTDEI